jgi:hypothetical protein
MLTEDEERLKQIDRHCEELQKNTTPVKSTFEERAHQAFKDKARYFELICNIYSEHSFDCNPNWDCDICEAMQEAQQMEQAFDKLEEHTA